MIKKIDSDKLVTLRSSSTNYADPEALRREGEIFFIGANLPIHSTLETMYESYCQESSELFHVTFGAAGMFEHNLEMVRQIKRNFSIRLMGRIEHPLSAEQVERVYLAGLDLLDIQQASYEVQPDDRWQTVLKTATATFTRWSVVSTIDAGHTTPRAVHESIEELLADGVVPLLKPTGESTLWPLEETANAFNFLAIEWQRYRVPLKPVMPLLRLSSPFVLAEPPGFLRGVIEKLQDRHIMATSDLRRHLRTSGAEASFESAGL